MKVAAQGLAFTPPNGTVQGKTGTGNTADDGEVSWLIGTVHCTTSAVWPFYVRVQGPYAPQSRKTFASDFVQT
jgi:membrane peptidoglycan carboxypeptidase